MATIEEAKALYEEWAEDDGKRAPWDDLDDRAQWAWRKIVDSDWTERP